MSSDTQSKVQARHLKRSAFLYVRQSSLRQVFENSESTKRQYDLRQRAISLGWHLDALDDAIGKLLIDTVTPLTLEVALAVQTELESRCDETERLRSHEVERARYQSDQARRRFMHVDPGNRLVADTLEAEWNQALRTLADAKERYEKQRQSDRAGLTDEQRAAIMALATDFPRLWNDPHTPQRERKRMGTTSDRRCDPAQE
jgi:hypothetical protein